MPLLPSCAPPLNHAAEHSASSSEMPESELGEIERSAAQAASEPDDRRAHATAATKSASAPTDVPPSSLRCLVSAPAANPSLARRFSPKTIGASVAEM